MREIGARGVTAWARAGVAVCAATVVCASCGDGSGGAGDDLSGVGTQLRDGLQVVEGSALVGSVFEQVAEDDSRWQAVLQVDGDPLEVWPTFLEQFPADLNPQLAVPGPWGCAVDLIDGLRPGCATYAIGGTRSAPDPFYVTLSAVPGTVTDTYVLAIDAAPGGFRSDMTRPLRPVEPGFALPAVDGVRPRPEVGEVLAPGVEARYSLLPGSEFVQQYGTGSNTGGFDVVLRVTAGADLDEVVSAYAEQADQFPDSEPGTVRFSRTEAETTYTTVYPPGGAGGYTAWIRVVDQPGDEQDYIYYTLAND